MKRWHKNASKWIKNTESAELFEKEINEYINPISFFYFLGVCYLKNVGALKPND